jgi:hypothetical protein
VQKVTAWIRRCLDILAETLTVATSTEEGHLLIDAARGRLLLSLRDPGPYVGDIKAISPRIRSEMQVAFKVRAAARPASRLFL